MDMTSEVAKLYNRAERFVFGKDDEFQIFESLRVLRNQDHAAFTNACKLWSGNSPKRLGKLCKKWFKFFNHGVPPGARCRSDASVKRWVQEHPEYIKRWQEYRSVGIMRA